MELKKLRLDDIKPYKNNPRKNDKAVPSVIESIKQCSYITPIVVDENYEILAGHTRYKALKALNKEEVECLVCDGLTDEQKKKYRYLDNKTGEKASWDLMKLEIELEGIDLEGFDFFGMGEDFSNQVVKAQEVSGSIEYDTEVFDDEKFKYECPKCGFRFN